MLGPGGSGDGMIGPRAMGGETDGNTCGEFTSQAGNEWMEQLRMVSTVHMRYECASVCANAQGKSE